MVWAAFPLAPMLGFVGIGVDSARGYMVRARLASGPTAPYYQYAPDAPALKAAFQEIGNHLSKLHLSK